MARSLDQNRARAAIPRRLRAPGAEEHQLREILRLPFTVELFVLNLRDGRVFHQPPGLTLHGFDI